MNVFVDFKQLKEGYEEFRNYPFNLERGIEMKRKKLILCFIGAVLLMTGCGGEASLPVYSNLSEEQVREQFETELIQAGAAETDAQKSMAIVKEYNDSIQNTSLVEEGSEER